MVTGARTRSGAARANVTARPSLLGEEGRGQLYAVLALALLSALGQCVSAGVVSLAASALIVAIALFSPLRACLLELYICLPFFNTMTSSVGSTSLYYLLLGVFIVKTLWKGGTDRFRYRFIALAVAILLTVANIEEPYPYIRWLLVATPLVLLAGSKVMGEELYRIVTLYSISSIVSAVFGYHLAEHGLLSLTDSYVYSQSGNINRFGGLVGDPVMFSETLVFLVACNLAFLLSGGAGKVSIMCVAGLAIPCALTYSRSSIVLLAALLVFSAVYVLMHHMLDRRKILAGVAALSMMLAVVAAVAVYVTDNPHNDIVSGFMTRLDSNDLLTGRDDLWESYVRWFSSQGVLDNLFGVGFAAYNQTSFLYEGLLLNRCHNVFLETVVLFGWIGALLLFILLVAGFVGGFRRRLPAPAFLPVIVLLLFGFILHGHVESFYYFLWTIALGFLLAFRTAGEGQGDYLNACDDCNTAGSDRFDITQRGRRWK